MFAINSVFNTSRFSGVSPDDKSEQERLQKAVQKNKRIVVKNPKSLRYAMAPDETGEQGIYDSNELAALWGMPSEVNFNVASTAIKDIKYDPKSGNLDIRFQGGKIWYTYYGVPEEVFTEFMDAPSRGKAFWVLIRPYSRYY